MITNHLKNKLDELEKLCEAAEKWDAFYSDFSGSLNIDYHSNESGTYLGFECPESIGKFFATSLPEMPKLIKALRLAIAGLEIAADDASFEGDKELEEAFWNRIKEIQQIMCGGGDE